MKLPTLILLFVAAELQTQAAEIRWHPNLLKQPGDWFGSAEALAVADSVLQYQSPQGGWPKSTDLAKPPKTPDDIPPPGRGRANSFDNEATTLPMQFLARVIHATGEARYRDAFARCLDYIHAAQYPNGGWPQFYPLRGEYYDRLTFNDNTMTRVMTLLHETASGRAPFDFVTDEQRAKAKAAVSKAVDCVLKTQVKQADKLAAWCAQYDEKSLQPAWARSFEPPCLASSESVGIVRFLMQLDDPAPEVITAVEGAVAWMKEVTVRGMRVQNVTDAQGRADMRLIPDSNAPGLWARFYDLQSNKPLFAMRDGVIYHDISQLSHEMRTGGYDFYGDWPAKLIEREYPAWRAKNQLPPEPKTP